MALHGLPIEAPHLSGGDFGASGASDSPAAQKTGRLIHGLTPIQAKNESPKPAIHSDSWKITG